MTALPNQENTGRLLKRTGVYQSPTLHEREERILRTTRELLGEVGYESMTMSEVAKRACVARATLYNAYTSKEHLALLTIEDSIHEILQSVNDQQVDSGIEVLLLRSDASLDEMMKTPEYTREMARLLFRSEIDNPIVDVLFLSGSESTVAHLREAQSKRQISQTLSAEQLANQIHAADWGAILEWSMGTIDDAELAAKRKIGLLLILLAVAKGRTKSRLQQALEQLS